LQGSVTGRLLLRVPDGEVASAVKVAADLLLTPALLHSATLTERITQD
jgi:hypothetical protein